VGPVHEIYTNDVIPLIKEGDYVKASRAVEGLVSHVNQEQERNKILAFVNGGGDYIVALDQLLDRLGEGNKEDIQAAMESLENCYTKTK